MWHEYRESVSHLIYRVGRLLRFQAALFFKEQGLSISPEQWGLLLRIAEYDGQAMSDLVDKSLGDHPNVTRLVDGLEAMGFVKREPNPGDKRSFLVSCTDAGQRFIDDVMPELTERKAEFYDGLDQDDLAELKKLLAVVETNLEK